MRGPRGATAIQAEIHELLHGDVELVVLQDLEDELAEAQALTLDAPGRPSWMLDYEEVYVVPCRDMSTDPEETGAQFEPCKREEAQVWTVTGRPFACYDWEVVEDYATEGEAERAARRIRQGWEGRRLS